VSARALAAFYAGVLILTLLLPSVWQSANGLLEARAMASAGWHDIGHLLARGLMGLGAEPILAVAAAGIAGHVLAIGVVQTTERMARWRPMLHHPAAILLTVCGLGFAVLGLLVFAAAITELVERDRAADVPALGVALLLLALGLPRFGELFLFVVSPLFLAAPSAMLLRHMMSFYLIALLPALVVLGVGLVTQPPGSEGLKGSAAVFAAATVAIGVFATPLRTRQRWRVGAILLVAAAGILHLAMPAFLTALLLSFVMGLSLRPYGARLMEAAASAALPPLVFLLR
jgi:hypothetical protein